MKKEKGITLIELLIVSLIIGISISTAIPIFGEMIQSSKTSGYSEDLNIELNNARINALTQSKTFTIIFDHKNGLYNWKVESKNKIKSKKEITVNEISLQYSNKEFSFSPYGFLLDENGNSLSNTKVTMCNIAINEGYSYTINSLGKIKMESTSC